jgi:hypothetical protein
MGLVSWFNLVVHFAPVIAAFLVSRTHRNINKITGVHATGSDTWEVNYRPEYGREVYGWRHEVCPAGPLPR